MNIPENSPVDEYIFMTASTTPRSRDLKIISQFPLHRLHFAAIFKKNARKLMLKSKNLKTMIPVAILAAVGIFMTMILPGCASSGRGKSWEQQLGAIPQGPTDPGKMRKEVRIKKDMIQKGRFGRRLDRPMTPRFITIHSTQNYTGDAFAHAKALKRGALKGGVCGYLCWHYTVQDNTAIQHIPTNERGEHADFDGQGNRESIGIEMCEHKGNNQARTIDRTAKLAASLMMEHNIPIQNIVPHYHWPRRGYSTPNKNCPHFLMDKGQPKATWKWFQDRVEGHYNRLVAYQQMMQQKQVPTSPIPMAPSEMQVRNFEPIAPLQPARPQSRD